MKTLKRILLLILIGLLVSREGPLPGAPETQINRLIAGRTFDYLGWELQALHAKGRQTFIPAQNYLPETDRKELVLRYIQWVGLAQQQSRRIAEIYSDPQIHDPDQVSASLRADHQRLRADMNQAQSTVESILEDQVAAILTEQGFAVGGQVLPPVKFRFSSLPYQLVISPRDEIRRMHEFSLEPDFTADRSQSLEDAIDRQLDVSSLVVPIGGMGLYPTMLLESESLDWLVGVIAHEWTHNWLTMFPLGWHYDASSELRTMNETTANIVENEIRPQVMARFYPELLPPPAPPLPAATPTPGAQHAVEAKPVFDFSQEMRLTRVEVDRLLQESRIAEAEAYMETRRQFLWEHGYTIRKLNQAYFAFYGAYADEPGASGEDPVGPAVARLRQRSPSLKAFLLEMAPMTSFNHLERALAE